MRRSYRIGNVSFGVRATSEEFGAWLDHTLAAYARRRHAAPEFSVIVDGGGNGRHRRGRRFHVLYHGVGALVRTFELSTLGAALLAELETRLLARRTDAVYVRAALVEVDGVRILVPSWLVPYLARLGRRVERAGVNLPLASWVAVDGPSGRVIRPRPTLDVPADALDRLARIDGSSVPTIGPDAPVRVDAVLTYDAGLDMMRRGTRGIALHRLAGLTPNLERVGVDALAALTTLIEVPNAYEIGLGRPQQMLEALVTLAEHERSNR